MQLDKQQCNFKLLHTCEKVNLWSDMPMPFSLLFMVAEPFGAFSITVWLFPITTQSCRIRKGKWQPLGVRKQVLLNLGTNMEEVYIYFFKIYAKKKKKHQQANLAILKGG